jgi:nucleotide-binding universal stress UspA family protein
MYKKILIAFDGSEPSKYALDHAVSIAAKWGSELIVLSVVPRVNTPLFPDGGPAPMTSLHLADYQDSLQEIYAKSLQEAEDDVKEAFPEVKISSKLLEGRPSSVIVEEADKEDVDLIVIGSRGIGGITGFILGSTSRRVVDTCTKPVLVVKTSR